jgi:hypothetical protein
MPTPNITAEVSEALSDRSSIVVVIRVDASDEAALIHFRKGTLKRERAESFAGKVRGPVTSLKETLQRIETASMDHGADGGMTFGLATMIADAT